MYHFILESPLSKNRTSPIWRMSCFLTEERGVDVTPLSYQSLPFCGEMLSKESDDGQRQNLLEYQDLII